MSNKRRTDQNDGKFDKQTNSMSANNEAPKFYTRTDEEFATEIADTRATQFQDQPRNHKELSADKVGKGRGWGLTAVILSIVAWFIWPLLLGPAAVITGIIAFTQGRKGLGSVAIVVGIIAFFSNIGNAVL